MDDTASSLLKKSARSPQQAPAPAPGPTLRASGEISPSKEELRVVIFSPLFPEYAARLAASLANHGSVRLITDRTGYEKECGLHLGSPEPSKLQTRLYQLFLRRSGMFAYIRDLLRALIDMWAFKPHIVHFQECPNFAHYIMVLLMKGSARIVVTVHDPLPHSGSDSKVDRPRIRSRIRAAANLLLGHGHHCCTELARLTRANGTEVRETTHGVLLCPPAALQREPIPGRVLLFGRMEQYKGLAVLLDAVELLGRRGLPLSLHLAGRGSELDRLAGRCRGATNITVRDSFLTSLEAVQEFQEACIVALPYLDASQSGVASAAFANGRPVVASRVGGLTDVVIDGVNGLLCEPGQPESLADALGMALSSPRLVRRLRQGAMNTAATSMDWGTIASRTAQYYGELLKRPRVSLPKA
ncbi:MULTISPECIES: glycosyltransferase family 4 protein [unclassified Mesorhizobium]|nr:MULTISPECIES: glycosyltransferase family 4 protein [unclassified Mesorhizobium]